MARVDLAADTLGLLDKTDDLSREEPTLTVLVFVGAG
jgi:hypothetical protein